MIADRVYVSCRSCGHRVTHEWRVDDADELAAKLALEYDGKFTCPRCGVTDTKASVDLGVPLPN